MCALTCLACLVLGVAGGLGGALYLAIRRTARWIRLLKWAIGQ